MFNRIVHADINPENGTVSSVCGQPITKDNFNDRISVCYGNGTVCWHASFYENNKSEKESLLIRLVEVELDKQVGDVLTTEESAQLRTAMDPVWLHFANKESLEIVIKNFQELLDYWKKSDTQA